MPTARDPWVILQLSPGVMVDRENVGISKVWSNWMVTGIQSPISCIERRYCGLFRKHCFKKRCFSVLQPLCLVCLSWDIRNHIGAEKQINLNPVVIGGLDNRVPYFPPITPIADYNT